MGKWTESSPTIRCVGFLLFQFYLYVFSLNRPSAFNSRFSRQRKDRRTQIGERERESEGIIIIILWERKNRETDWNNPLTRSFIQFRSNLTPIDTRFSGIYFCFWFANNSYNFNRLLSSKKILHCLGFFEILILPSFWIRSFVVSAITEDFCVWFCINSANLVCLTKNNNLIWFLKK